MSLCTHVYIRETHGVDLRLVEFAFDFTNLIMLFFVYIVMLICSNIIEDGGRPRRRAAPVAFKPAENDLPSDFSGAELSVNDDEEEEGDDYSLSPDSE